MKTDCYLTYSKHNSKSKATIDMKEKSIKLLVQNIGMNIHNPGSCNRFILDTTV